MRFPAFANNLAAHTLKSPSVWLVISQIYPFVFTALYNLLLLSTLLSTNNIIVLSGMDLTYSANSSPPDLNISVSSSTTNLYSAINGIVSATSIISFTFRPFPS